MSRYTPWIKIVLVVAVAFFAIKFVSSWAANTWPNKITQTAATIAHSF